MVRFLFLFLCSTAFACTDFVLQAKDGTWVNGRSLEFALDLKAVITAFPKGQKMASLAPNQKGGLSWTSKYNYLGIKALEFSFAFDGLNEVGLSCALLWLPGVTDYPVVTMDDQKKIVDFVDFCDWALGNFASVAEVKEALQKVQIWGHEVAPLGKAPIHVALHDAKGKSLVIEFVKGSMQIYENPIGVLTNSPPFDWQCTNLQNFLSLSPYNPNPITFKDVLISPPGQGGGFWGLPGDLSPPSRFVKIVTFLRFVGQTASGLEAVNLAEHLLNTVDIPIGIIRDPDKETGDFTQWIVIKDLTQKALYFRSYADLVLKKIDLKKLNFLREKKSSLSIDLKKGYIDVTDSFGRASLAVMNE